MFPQLQSPITVLSSHPNQSLKIKLKEPKNTLISCLAYKVKENNRKKFIHFSHDQIEWFRAWFSWKIKLKEPKNTLSLCLAYKMRENNRNKLIHFSHDQIEGFCAWFSWKIKLKEPKKTLNLCLAYKVKEKDRKKFTQEWFRAWFSRDTKIKLQLDAWGTEYGNELVKLQGRTLNPYAIFQGERKVSCWWIETSVKIPFDNKLWVMAGNEFGK